jgi:hypothetical protein
MKQSRRGVIIAACGLHTCTTEEKDYAFKTLKEEGHKVKHSTNSKNIETITIEWKSHTYR